MQLWRTVTYNNQNKITQQTWGNFSTLCPATPNSELFAEPASLRTKKTKRGDLGIQEKQHVLVKKMKVHSAQWAPESLDQSIERCKKVRGI